MLVDKLLSTIRPINTAPAIAPMTLPELINMYGGGVTVAGERVTPESSKKIATAYRCGNILSDDVAKMPLQVYQKTNPRTIERILPDGRLQNLAWMLEIRPNRWMNPFVWKKTTMLWLIFHGNAYIWQPPNQRELFILPAHATYPEFLPNGSLWYHTTFANGVTDDLPDTEILHLMINSIDGFFGRSVITYARETLGRQLGAHRTQSKFYDQGLNASGILWSSADLSEEARNKARESFERAASGSDNAYRVVVADSKFSKFEQISMKASDMQFLQGIEATDTEICNFFGLPMYKLNQGKQAYNSNEQQNIDYLNTTLDPYLVQWEQAAALSWLSTREQGSTYFRFNRDVLLRTAAAARTDVLVKKIQSGQLSINEARNIEDQSAFEGGDEHYMPANYVTIGGKGNVNVQPGKN